MPSLFGVLARAYSCTKNHKFLWFFGFFLSATWLLNFLKAVNLEFINSLYLQSSSALLYKNNKIELLFVILGLALVLFVIFFLGIWARTILFNSAVLVSRKEKISPQIAIRRSAKFFWRVFTASFLINTSILIILIWLFAPVIFIFSQGFLFRSVFLGLIALGIFLPIFLMLYLANLFANCFIIAFDMKLKGSIKSAFDLLYRFWPQAASFLMVLLFIYLVFFFLSTSLFGFAVFAAYSMASTLHLQGHAFIMLVFLLFLLGFVLVAVNAVINVFSNSAWVLFFLELIRSKPLQEQKEPEAIPKPVV